MTIWNRSINYYLEQKIQYRLKWVFIRKHLNIWVLFKQDAILFCLPSFIPGRTRTQFKPWCFHHYLIYWFKIIWQSCDRGTMSVTVGCENNKLLNSYFNFKSRNLYQCHIFLLKCLLSMAFTQLKYKINRTTSQSIGGNIPFNCKLLKFQYFAHCIARSTWNLNKLGQDKST